MCRQWNPAAKRANGERDVAFRAKEMGQHRGGGRLRCCPLNRASGSGGGRPKPHRARRLDHRVLANGIECKSFQNQEIANTSLVEQFTFTYFSSACRHPQTRRCHCLSCVLPVLSCSLYVLSTPQVRRIANPAGWPQPRLTWQTNPKQRLFRLQRTVRDCAPS